MAADKGRNQRDVLAQLAAMRAGGEISAEEFQAARERILGPEAARVELPPPPPPPAARGGRHEGPEKPPRRKSGCGAVILVIIVVAVIAAIVGGQSHSGSTGKTAFGAGDVAEKVATLDKSPKMQADRKALIAKLIAAGAFTKVEVPGSAPRVWVTPAFMQLEFDLKQKYVGVVYAYYYDGSNEADFVRVIDSVSGKEVGQYSIVGGGLKMY